MTHPDDYDLDDDRDNFEEDPDQEFLDYVCGMMDDGFCSMAGSEDCDFECPRRRF